MKRLLTLMFILPCISFVYAQEANDYRPFIEEGKVWVSRQGLPTNPYWGEYIRYDYFEGDTVVGGHLCKRWVQEYVSRDGGEFISPDGDRVYRFMVPAYEEEGKVFFFFSGETQPHLWFDFGAADGDTLFVSVPYAPLWESFGHSDDFYEIEKGSGYRIYFQNTIIIQRREEKVLGGRTQQVVTFKTTDLWLEESEKHIMVGIGSNYSPDWVMSYPYGNRLWPYPNAALALCYKDDEILYYDQEVIDTYRILLPTAISLPQIVNGRTAQNDASHLKKSANGKCFDLTGRRLAAPPAKGVYIRDGKKVAR